MIYLFNENRITEKMSEIDEILESLNVTDLCELENSLRGSKISVDDKYVRTQVYRN